MPVLDDIFGKGKHDGRFQRRDELLNHVKIYETTGSSHRKLIVKVFNENSYNGPTLHDFVDRLTIIFESIKREIKSRAEKNQNDSAETIKELTRLKNQTLKKIQHDCVIEPMNIAALIKNDAYVVNQIKKARSHIQLFVANAMLLIQANAFQSNKEFNAVKQALEKAEVALTIEKGRLDFINYYPVPTPGVMRVSAQRVIGDHIIPSTKRDDAKLPNFVEITVGYLKDKGLITQFKGYRHSSFVPIFIDDKFKRRQYTSAIAKELFAELAKNKTANKEGVIELSLASLMLLTPVGKRTEPIGWTSRWREKEYRQLKESYDALMMYNGRTIEIMGQDGLPIKVKPMINAINTPANPLGVFLSKIRIHSKVRLHSSLEAGINAQGMNQFICDAEKHLRTLNVDLNLNWTSNKKTTALVHKIEPLKDALRGEYAKLDLYLNEGNKEKYTAQQKIVRNQEKKIFTLEKKLIGVRRKLFKLHQYDIKDHLQTLESSVPSVENDKIRLFQQLYYQSLAMYMKGKIEPMQLGARYLLANESMGKSVDFYCKSGEDRTGRMQNLVEELCEFARQNNRYPSYSFKHHDIKKDDRLTQQKIATYVSEFSVSRDINGQNVHGARGLQIGTKLGPFYHRINEGLPNASGNTLATLAKEVYNVRNVLKTTNIPKNNLDNNNRSPAKFIGLFGTCRENKQIVDDSSLDATHNASADKTEMGLLISEQKKMKQTVKTQQGLDSNDIEGEAKTQVFK